MRWLVVPAVLLLALGFARCSSNDCNPATCTGCCLDGACKVGSVRAACGHDGGACQICNDEQLCTSSRCVQTCDNTVCTGCCSVGQCTAAPKPCQPSVNFTVVYSLWNTYVDGGVCIECSAAVTVPGPQVGREIDALRDAGCSVTQDGQNANAPCPCANSCAQCRPPPGCASNSCACSPVP